MRNSIFIGAFFLLTFAGSVAQSQDSNFPDLIPLPEGFGPEGIAVGNGTTFYVGAGIGSKPELLGQILVGDLRKGTFSQLVAPAGKHALGIKFFSPGKLLFVAGGPSGTGRVYDADSGSEVASYVFKKVPAPGVRTNVNDVIVTNDAAYFTDSQNPTLYRVAIEKNAPAKTFDSIPLPSQFGPPTGSCKTQVRANGITAHPNGKHLIIANSNVGQIFRMDTETNAIEQIKLTGGEVCNADGLLLDGKTLYVAQSVDNRIAVLGLSEDLLSGTIERHITEPFASNPKTKIPTTLAEFGKSLYTVTAGFDDPKTDFVVRLPK